MDTLLGLPEIFGAVLELDPALSQDSDEFKAAVILLSGAIFSNKSKPLIAFTKYSPEFVRMCARNLRKNGIWRKRQTCCEWLELDSLEGQTAFWLDAMVALGTVQRENADAAVA